MATKPLPTPRELRQLLRYEPETGKLFWRERRPEWFTDGHRSADHQCNLWNARYAGREAFARKNGDGRMVGEIFSRPHKAHRVAWALVYGAWPAECVDHIDRDPSNNRIANLRLATKSQNQYNRVKTKANTSGFKGAFFDKRRATWFAAITVDSKSIYLGAFASAESASEAYAAAARVYHSNFARIE